MLFATHFDSCQLREGSKALVLVFSLRHFAFYPTRKLGPATVPSEMAADDEIRERLLYILQKADLTVMTERIARKQLEQDLGISLADRKPFIREEVGKFLQGRNKQTREEAEDGEEEVDGSDGGQKNKRKAKVL